MPKNLEKAEIEILEGTNSNTLVTVLFNPAEYTHEISSSFEEKKIPGLNHPVLQFVNGDLQTLSMELFFDVWTDPKGVDDVSILTKRFTDLLAIDKSLHRPPVVRFSWGSFSFRAYVVSISQRFTMFHSDGRPVRATLSVKYKQFQDIDEQLSNPSRNSVDKTKTRIFTADDSLWAIAQREYSDIKQWRLIAQENKISNPRTIEPGTLLKLPLLE